VKAAAAILVMAASVVFATATMAPSALGSISEDEFTLPTANLRSEPKAPMAVSEDGNNVYIVWWSNKSENWEVMFRASNDGGRTFGHKINPSNSSDAESQNADIIAFGNSVYVTWWETSPITGSSESVLRVSMDAGQTFGPVMMLGMNGTMSTTTTNSNTTTATTAEEGEEELLPNEELVPTEEEA
jgi:hypothetical protein